MLGENSSFKGVIPVSTVLAVFLAFAGIWVTEKPYQSQRPSAQAIYQSPSATGETVFSQPGEDPFMSLWQHKASVAGESNPQSVQQSLQTLRAEIGLRSVIDVSDQCQAERILILAIQSPRGGNANEIETRRRQMHTLNSVFSIHGIFQRDQNALGILRAPRLEIDADERSLTVTAGSVEIPYDWYQLRAQNENIRYPNRVLTLWLYQDDFNNHSLASVSALLTTLIDKTWLLPACADSKYPDIAFSVIGPSDSVDLAKLLSEELIFDQHLEDSGQWLDPLVQVGLCRFLEPDCLEKTRSEQALRVIIDGEKAALGVNQNVISLFEGGDYDTIAISPMRVDESDLSSCLAEKFGISGFVDETFFPEEYLANCESAIKDRLSVRRLGYSRKKGVAYRSFSRLQQQNIKDEISRAREERESTVVVSQVFDSPLAKPSEIYSRINLHSSRVTVPLSQLAIQSDHKNLEDPISEAGIRHHLGINRFERAMVDDYETLTLVLRELHRRGIPLCTSETKQVITSEESGETNHKSKGETIALFVELNSIYQTSIQTIGDDYCENELHESEPEQYRLNARIFGYFKHIDGLSENRKTLAPTTNAANTNKSIAGYPASIQLPARNREYAFGTHRIDYVRRIANQIERDVGTQERSSETQNLANMRAIGVFGTDVYDKILMFESIKQVMPSMLLFTIDLDASYGHPSYQGWTRNLVVGSGLGLEHENTKMPSVFERHATHDFHLAPFRDSYQTAFYTSMQQVLADSYKPLSQRYVEESQEDTDKEQLKALQKAQLRTRYSRLSEVGRNGIVDITPLKYCQKNCVDENSTKSWGDQNFGWTKFATQHSIMNLFKVLVLLIPLLILISSIFRQRLHLSEWQLARSHLFQTSYRGKLYQADTDGDGEPDTVIGGNTYSAAINSERDALLKLGLFVSIVTVILMLALTNWNSKSFEPLLLFDGVSGLPTLVLRFCAILISVSMVIQYYNKIRRSNLKIQSLFGLPKPSRHPLQSANKPNSEQKRGRIADLLYRYSLTSFLLESRNYEQLESQLSAAGELSSTEELWVRYRHLGATKSRLLRVSVMTAIFAGITFSVMMQNSVSQPLIRLFDNPLWTNALLKGINSLAIITVIFVIFLAGDAMKLCRGFVRALGSKTSGWEGGKIPGYPQWDHYQNNLRTQLAHIELIMLRTETIAPLVVYPMGIILLLVFARSSMFEGWHWSPTATILYGSFAVYLFLHSLTLQREAERSQARIIANLEALKLATEMQLRGHKTLAQTATTATQDSQDSHQELDDPKVIEHVIDSVSHLHRGAFKPILRHPVFQAIALPSTGIGILALLQLVM